MRGRLVALLIATCFSASLCFSQIFEPAQSPGLTRHGSLGSLPASQIAGTITGSDGAPLPDVRVEVRNDQTGQSVASGYTNAGGAFDFQGLPAGEYEVVASRGLLEQREHLSLGDISANVKMTLDTSNPAATRADGRATVSVAEYKVPQKARDALHKAQEALSKGRIDDAKKELAKSLSIYPNYAPALTMRGVLALDDAKSETAVDDFDKAIHADPEFPMAYTGMAAAMNQLQKFDDAIRCADRAITLAPRAWQSYFEMAKAYVGKSEFKQALEQLSKTQEFLTKEYAPIHLVRAHALIALQQYPGAADELNAFLSLAPQDPNAPMARQALEKIKASMAAAMQPREAGVH